ncbi:uncharacterized protein [Haliotis asinina]|uniref:uncharacterized protein n=1 Tax=Haliotis asinina TaxID=109174 RepID=UPI003531A4A0
MSVYRGALRRLMRAYPTLNLRIAVNPSQHEADVVLPGLRYEDIDYTGQPDIWRIYDMMGRVEFAAFFQDYSFIDFTSLYKKGIGAFAKAVSLEIKKGFYQTTTPKAPLHVHLKLDHIGETTFTVKSSLSTGGKHTPSVNIQSQYTLQHVESKLVEKIPNWWRIKFAPHISADAQKLIIYPPMDIPKQVFSHSLTVPRIDTDIHTRTRCSSYAKYFMDNASIASHRAFYPNVSTSFHELLVKKMKMVYFSASSWGDTLTAETWEDEEIPRTLHCNVIKQGQHIWYGSMVFHSEPSDISEPSLTTI